MPLPVLKSSVRQNQSIGRIVGRQAAAARLICRGGDNAAGGELPRQRRSQWIGLRLDGELWIAIILRRVIVVGNQI